MKYSDDEPGTGYRRSTTNSEEPVDIAGFRARREELKRERRQRGPIEYVPDHGRQIPPPINPEVNDMVDQLKACYTTIGRWIVGFQDEVAALIDGGQLDPDEGRGLPDHYRDLQDALDAATTAALEWTPSLRILGVPEGRSAASDAVHRLADHAKYVYAIGTRDIAGLQFRLAELANTGLPDFKEHERLQRDHCLPMWEALYHGTTSAVRDKRTWDGAWDWYDNTYSDGRQVMVRARVKNWIELDRDWPDSAGMCGDGPILEHPRGSLCQIFPVVDPRKGCYYDYASFEIDLDGLIEQRGWPPFGLGTKPESAMGDQ